MRFADPTDEGSMLALETTDAAVKRQRALNQPEQKKVKEVIDGQEVEKWEHEDCVDCGEPIEPERLEHARVRCISCQRIKEEKETRYARR